MSQKSSAVFDAVRTAIAAMFSVEEDTIGPDTRLRDLGVDDADGADESVSEESLKELLQEGPDPHSPTGGVNDRILLKLGMQEAFSIKLAEGVFAEPDLTIGKIAEIVEAAGAQ